jgi:hypothetical protein
MFGKCTRCGRTETIPKGQFLKFDIRKHHVCKECWDKFRKWFSKPKSESYKYGIAA